MNYIFHLKRKLVFKVQQQSFHQFYKKVALSDHQPHSKVYLCTSVNLLPLIPSSSWLRDFRIHDTFVCTLAQTVWSKLLMDESCYFSNDSFCPILDLCLQASILASKVLFDPGFVPGKNLLSKLLSLLFIRGVWFLSSFPYLVAYLMNAATSTQLK